MANVRAELDLYITTGNSGLNALRNKRSMQHKRKAPSMPLYFWSVDGWDAELLYQKVKDGTTTYHNRLTMVVVLDMFNEYPIGYAIGTHETPALIRAAVRNAIQHTKELFGEYHLVQQLQSDNYGRGALNSVYEAESKYYTPARVGNAKAKPIEPFFDIFN